jgi:hypothetical protein
LDFIKEENEIQRYLLYFRSILCLQDCCSCTNQLLPTHRPELRKKKTNDAGILSKNLEMTLVNDCSNASLGNYGWYHLAYHDEFGLILHQKLEGFDVWVFQDNMQDLVMKNIIGKYRSNHLMQRETKRLTYQISLLQTLNQVIHCGCCYALQTLFSSLKKKVPPTTTIIAKPCIYEAFWAGGVKQPLNPPESSSVPSSIQSSIQTEQIYV